MYQLKRALLPASAGNVLQGRQGKLCTAVPVLCSNRHICTHSEMHCMQGGVQAAFQDDWHLYASRGLVVKEYAAMGVGGRGEGHVGSCCQLCTFSRT